MKFFSFRHGTFRRLGVEGTIGGMQRRMDLTRGWRRFVSDRRLSLPSFPDLDDLLVNGWFTSKLVGDCVDHLQGLPARDLDELTLPANVVFDVPVKHPGQIICLVKNYRAHAEEMGGEPPKEPLFFSKLTSSLLPHGGTITLPDEAEFPGEVHHEAELAVVIGKTARNLDAASARDVIAGYTILNDVSHRGVQRADKQAGMPWTRSKGFDTFCPCGPYIVLPADFGDDTAQTVRCRVNDDVRQDGSTSLMVFDVPTILAAVTRYTTLRPGDLVATGTPAGVGPITRGDTVTCEITGIGQLVNPVA